MDCFRRRSETSPAPPVDPDLSSARLSIHCPIGTSKGIAALFPPRWRPIVVASVRYALTTLFVASGLRLGQERPSRHGHEARATSVAPRFALQRRLVSSRTAGRRSRPLVHRVVSRLPLPSARPPSTWRGRVTSSHVVVPYGTELRYGVSAAQGAASGCRSKHPHPRPSRRTVFDDRGRFSPDADGSLTCRTSRTLCLLLRPSSGLAAACGRRAAAPGPPGRTRRTVYFPPALTHGVVHSARSWRAAAARRSCSRAHARARRPSRSGP